MSDLGTVLVASLVAVALVMAVVALVARRLDRVTVVDVGWGLGFAAVAIVAAALASSQGGTPWRSWLLAALTTVWGVRLALHIRGRATGKGEDPRYVAMLGDSADGTRKPNWFAIAVRKVFLTQGLLQWLVSLPLQVAAVCTVDAWPLVVAGVLVWGVGLFFETVGDRQLEAYKRLDPKPKVLDTGLWRYTRHPNYFGDACVWVGLFLVAAASWPVWWTILSPAVMVWLLVWGSGARLTEKTMMKRDGYPEYAGRTSMFVPLPPSKA